MFPRRKGGRRRREGGRGTNFALTVAICVESLLSNSYHQLELIHSLLGRPDSEALRKIPDTTMKQYFMSLPNRDPRPLKEIFNEAQPDALAFLRRLIQLDPDRRPTAEEALRDPYFQDIFIEEDLIQADPIPDHEFAFELEKQTEEKLRSIFLEEILHYHPEMREKLVGNLRMDPSQLRFDVPSEVTDFRGQFKQVQVFTFVGLSTRYRTTCPPLLCNERAHLFSSSTFFSGRSITKSREKRFEEKITLCLCLIND